MNAAFLLGKLQVVPFESKLNPFLTDVLIVTSFLIVKSVVSSPVILTDCQNDLGCKVEIYMIPVLKT